MDILKLLKYLVSCTLFFQLSVFAKDINGAQDFHPIGRYPDSHIISHTKSSFDKSILLLSTNSYAKPNDFKQKAVSGPRTTIVYNVPSAANATALGIHAALELGLKTQGFDIHLSCFAAAQGENCGYFLHQKIVSERTAKTTFGKFREFYNLTSADFGMVSATKDKLAVWIVVAKSSYSPTIQYSIDVIEQQDLVVKDLILTTQKLAEDIDNTGKAKLAGVYFQHNSANLTEASQTSLNAIANYLKSVPTQEFLVVGHTDSIGKYQDNFALSQARADSVRDYLIRNKNIEPNRLHSIGLSYASPIASNTNSASRAKNRRVEIVLKFS